MRLELKEGRLLYNDENDRFCFAMGNKWLYDGWFYNGYHCGEAVEVKIDGAWLKTRFEMDINNEWYLVGTNYKGKAIEGLPARAEIDVTCLKNI